MHRMPMFRVYIIASRRFPSRRRIRSETLIHYKTPPPYFVQSTVMWMALPFSIGLFSMTTLIRFQMPFNTSLFWAAFLNVRVYVENDERTWTAALETLQKVCVFKRKKPWWWRGFTQCRSKGKLVFDQLRRRKSPGDEVYIWCSLCSKQFEDT